MRKLKITELNRTSIDDYKKTDKISLVVVLDNIRSLNNIGSVFRTSDAFLIESIFLCGITATPPNAEIHKTALGAEFSVDWTYFQDTCSAIAYLKKNDYEVFAVEQVKDSTSLENLSLNKEKKYAIILGNEVKGVQQSAIDMCDGTIEIPQFGTKHSLNVSVTAGIVIWDVFKQLKGEYK